MKVNRSLFFSFFAVSMLISINMIYNVFRGGIGYGMWPIVVVALVYIVLQFAGLFTVVANRGRVITGVSVIVAGVATALSGAMTFSVLGAPAPQFLSMLSTVSLVASVLVCIGYFVLGILALTNKPDEVK